MPEDPQTPNNPPTMTLTSDAVIDASGFQVTLLNAKFVVPADVAKTAVDNKLAPSTNETFEKERDMPRKRLLARMAGNIAGGMCDYFHMVEASVTRDGTASINRTAVADAAVDLAEKILTRIGL